MFAAFSETVQNTFWLDRVNLNLKMWQVEAEKGQAKETPSSSDSPATIIKEPGSDGQLTASAGHRDSDLRKRSANRAKGSAGSRHALRDGAVKAREAREKRILTQHAAPATAHQAFSQLHTVLSPTESQHVPSHGHAQDYDRELTILKELKLQQQAENKSKGLPAEAPPLTGGTGPPQ